MDYKVMKRPMFRVGGPTSGGTGITSGLDTPKRGLVDGPGGYAGAMENFINLDSSNEMQKILQSKMLNRDQNYNSMMSLPKLQAIGNIATNVLPNVERGGLKGIVDILKDPATINAAIQGLTQTKQLELQRDKQQIEDMGKVVSMRQGQETITRDQDNKDRMFDLEGQKYDLSKEKFDSDTEYKSELIRIKELELAKKSESKTIQNYNAVKTMLETTGLSDEKQLDILLGVLTGGAYQSVQKQSANLNVILTKSVIEGNMSESKKNSIISAFEEVNLDIFKNSKAEGGRINKQMGGGFNMGQEQPMQATQTTAPGPEMMQQGDGQNTGQDPFTILRERLPQEISDEVVSLIAYNKAAFQDFANIQDQDDVDLFNQKYNVQLVVDMASR